MRPQPRANMPRFGQPFGELQRTRHLRLTRTIAAGHVGDDFPGLQLRMPEGFFQAQHRLDAGIDIGKQPAEFAEIMLLELDLQRLLEHLLSLGLG
ncbi:hypothetical protein SRABI112_04732 [Pseudomonas mediterranea]|nr:hypothetical protein SRABI112_04732 [Pseudomonas mediterranea]